MVTDESDLLFGGCSRESGERWRLAGAIFFETGLLGKDVAPPRSGRFPKQVRCGEAPQPAREGACAPRMNLSPRFFRFGAVCAVLTALTTLIVHIVPNLWADATTFEQQVELRLNPIYLAQRWTILLHCALVILSMFVLGAAKLRSAPLLVSCGFLGYLCFGFTEILRTSISIFAVNRTWRAGYAAAADTLRGSISAR
jgi:hypothetical protein